LRGCRAAATGKRPGRHRTPATASAAAPSPPWNLTRMSLEPVVIVLVLMAAVMHATWNALVKAGGDKTAMQFIVIVSSGIPALIALPFFPLPAPASWPYLAASTVIHFAYYVTLLG